MEYKQIFNTEIFNQMYQIKGGKKITKYYITRRLKYKEKKIGQKIFMY